MRRKPLHFDRNLEGNKKLQSVRDLNEHENYEEPPRFQILTIVLTNKTLRKFYSEQFYIQFIKLFFRGVPQVYIERSLFFIIQYCI